MWYSRKGLEKGSSDSYILKNKNLDIALLQVDSVTGAIKSVLDIFLPTELPLGCSADGNGRMVEKQSDSRFQKRISASTGLPGCQNQSVADAGFLWSESHRSLLDTAYRRAAYLGRAEFL